MAESKERCGWKIRALVLSVGGPFSWWHMGMTEPEATTPTVAQTAMNHTAGIKKLCFPKKEKTVKKNMKKFNSRLEKFH